MIKLTGLLGMVMVLLVGCARGGTAVPSPIAPTVPTSTASATEVIDVVAVEGETAVPPPRPTTQSPPTNEPSPTNEPTLSAPPPSSPITIDQQNTFFDGGLWSIRWLAPVGQEFRPMQSTFDMIVLWVESAGAPEAAVVQVHIHADSLEGERLASSDAVPIPVGFAGAAVFPFAVPVAVQPGELYVLWVELVAGENTAVAWIQHGGHDDPYPDGQAISEGQLQPESDLWFQVGKE
jgi:hypothetical protein